MLDLGKLVYSDFSPHLNGVFTIQIGDLCIETRLVRVVPWGDTHDNRRQPFALTFRGPREPILPQQIHALGNPLLGTLEIFLVPVGPDELGMQYEAIFS